MPKSQPECENLAEILQQESFYHLQPAELEAVVYFLEGDSRVDACLKAGLVKDKSRLAGRVKACRFFKRGEIESLLNLFRYKYSERIGSLVENEVAVLESLKELAFSEDYPPKIKLAALRELRECLRTFSLFTSDSP